MKLFYEHTCTKTGKKFRKQTDHFVWKILLPVIGLFSLVWFLIRVIPKPSRIMYPCQKVAAPLGLQFIFQIIALLGIKKISLNGLKMNKKQIVASLAISLFIIMSLVFFSPHFNVVKGVFTGVASVNEIVLQDVVYGIGKGIFPGRVTWSHNSKTTTWNGTSGFWWEDKNTNQELVDEMVSKSIMSLTGEKSTADAWKAIFEYYNDGEGYKSGEKIAIKLNMNGVSRHDEKTNACFNSPHLVYSVLKQLVNVAGILPEDITVFDASRAIHNSVYDKCNVDGLKGVVFADANGGNGRIKSIMDRNNEVYWSYAMGGERTFLPEYITEATYLINLSSLKGHNLTGVTLSGKNHFGTIMTKEASDSQPMPPQEANLHGYIAAHSVNWGEKWTFLQREMGSYNPIVDLIGHKDLGGKTVLYIIDGMYVSQMQNSAINSASKWISEPFSRHWPSSILMSMDPVAIDSVGTDFILNEPVIQSLNEVIHPKTTLLNYLHEAALANNPPSKTIYTPNGDGKVLNSLGVYEHWNNSKDKQYSRNLGKNEGIELIKVSLSDGSQNHTPTNSPSPAISKTPTNSPKPTGSDISETDSSSILPTPDLISYATANENSSDVIVSESPTLPISESISDDNSDSEADESIIYSDESQEKNENKEDNGGNPIFKFIVYAIIALCIVAGTFLFYNHSKSKILKK